MATTADFKNGLYLNFNGKPCQIVWFQHVKPGKGPAFVKSKLRNLENGRILENTFTAGAKIDTINVERRPYQFLYKDEDGFNFMHEETYEQIHLDAALVDNADLMKEGQHVEMMFLADEERCLTCELPTYVELEVTYTEPAVKGDTASTNAQKEVTLETGAITSTSQAAILLMPAAGTRSRSRLTPKAILAERITLCQVSMPSTSVEGSASA